MRQILIFLTVFCSSLLASAAEPQPKTKNQKPRTAADRPNILYIALEDITPMMGCYGDEYAKTPVFDQLAAEGIRYTNAHSVAPVCSVSRSSIVTGMYPSTIGTLHHRSGGLPAPAFLKFEPNQNQ